VRQTGHIALLCLCLLPGLTADSAAQDLILKGRIRDRNTHEDIPAVNVFIQGSAVGTTTDFSGRFTLSIPFAHRNGKLVLQHVAYHTAVCLLDSLPADHIFYLVPQMLFLQGMDVTATNQRSGLSRDLPQTLAILDEKQFALRGYVDAGDFLRTDPSIQVTEELSGKKSVTLRGGNADEVLVLYAGVRLNGLVDNVFDFSQMDPDHIDRIELVKGSHAALYGSGALSGLIHIVPKTMPDHHIRFQQSIGSYDAGQWGLSLYHPLQRLHPTYSYKTGASRRMLSSPSTSYALNNRSTQHQASLRMGLDDARSDSSSAVLEAYGLDTRLSYENERDAEKLDRQTRLGAVKFSGDLGPVTAMTVSAAWTESREGQSFYLRSNRVWRDLADKSVQLRMEKGWRTAPWELWVAYGWENDDLDWQDQSAVIETIDVRRQRRQQSMTAVAKFHAETGAAFIPLIDFDLSARHDRVTDDFVAGEKNTASYSAEAAGCRWQSTPLNFAVHAQGRKTGITLNSYLNYGRNVRFPTLMQMMSRPVAAVQSKPAGEWQPEEINGLEVGGELMRRLAGAGPGRGWRVNMVLFRHYYKNKMRPLYSIGVPIVYYDYVADAKISGIEANSTVFLFDNQIKVDAGFVHYQLSDRAAFPWKFDTKYLCGVQAEHSGFSLQVHLFYESDQTGLIRSGSDQVMQATLSGYSDMNLHLGKTVNLGGIKGLVRVAIFNLMNERTQLAGLALRDRRYTLTATVQY